MNVTSRWLELLTPLLFPLLQTHKLFSKSVIKIDNDLIEKVKLRPQNSLNWFNYLGEW